MSCPVCAKKTDLASRPFCSKRCADIDLARWLGEGYRIGGEEGHDESSSDQPGPPERQH